MLNFLLPASDENNMEEHAGFISASHLKRQKSPE